MCLFFMIQMGWPFSIKGFAPIIVIVINNHGGAIFSLLPISNTTHPDVLDKYFYTTHDVSIQKLCAAHSVKHLLVQTKADLQIALWKYQQEQIDCVIEVQSCIADNADFHRIIRMSACQAATQALGFLLDFLDTEHVQSLSFIKIDKMEYMLCRIQLFAPPTSRQFDDVGNELFHEGFILTIHLDDNTLGFGEEHLYVIKRTFPSFVKKATLPVALDETIDNLKGDILCELQKFVHAGIVALVIKPSVVGGFENAALIAKWAQLHGKMAVVSSAFESSLSLSAYVQFAHYLELQNAAICRLKKRDLSGAIAHGLGTYRWLKEDVSDKGLKICVPPYSNNVEASVEDAHSFVQNLQINKKRIQGVYTEEQLRSYNVKVKGGNFSCLFKLQEAGSCTNKKVVIFLHGFLGTSDEWTPTMKALSHAARGISVDLPGHGDSPIQWHSNEESKQKLKLSVETVADLLLKLICDITDKGVILVGYSMGARIALHMALRYSEKIDGAVIISGSPGLRDEASRRIRRALDKSRARLLLTHGLQCFLDTWYSGNLWRSLREHPHFDRIIKSRTRHNDIKALAKAFYDSSIGEQKSMWEDLKHCKRPLLFIVGEVDTKFKEISLQMCREITSNSRGSDYGQKEELCERLVIPDCGHAVHLENPLPVINAVRKFITKLERL